VSTARRRRRALRRCACAALLAGLLAAASAQALHLQIGELVVDAEGGFSPTALPKTHDAPITIHAGGKISTADGKLPPVLKTLTILFDRHGSLQTEGLPACTRAKLLATSTEQARRQCPGAIVGKGFGRAVIAFPESKPVPVSSPITLFNGPRRHGDATVIAHAYLTYPVPTTYLLQVTIERIHKGVYGYRTVAQIPKIADGSGIPISGSLKIGRQWTYKGVHRSYVNARCETGRLQAEGQFTFSDGTLLKGTFVRACKVRG
jgi:hypothetical protein